MFNNLQHSSLFTDCCYVLLDFREVNVFSSTSLINIQYVGTSSLEVGCGIICSRDKNLGTIHIG